MKKIIINYDEDTDPQSAIYRVLMVVKQGMISESAGRKHYCWHTRFQDGSTVSVHRKRKDNSADSFVINQNQKEKPKLQKENDVKKSQTQGYIDVIRQQGEMIRQQKASVAVTADGEPLSVGDKIWVKSDTQGNPPTQHIVAEIMKRKILYTKPDKEGHVGAKLTSVFRHRHNAFWV